MTGDPLELVFAVNLASFLVVAAGLALVLLRATSLSSRTGNATALALGFTGLAAAFFLHGSLLVPSATAPILVWCRGIGTVLVLVGAVWGWIGRGRPPRPRRAGAERPPLPAWWWSLVGVAVVLQGASLGASLLGRPFAGTVLLAAGTVVLGAWLGMASRRSVAGRVVASAGATLLALVLVLSVALSTVLITTVSGQTTRRLEAQAQAQVTEIHRLTYVELPPRALLMARLVQTHLDTTSGCGPSSEPCVASYLPVATNTYLPGSDVLWVHQGGGPPANWTVAASAHARTALGPGIEAGLAASQVVTQASQANSSVASVVKVGGRALAVAAAPDATSSATGAPQHLVGVALAVAPLDGAFLADQRNLGGPDVSLALLAGGMAGPEAGSLPSPARLQSFVAPVLADGRQRTARLGDRLVVARSVPDDHGRPALAVVAATPATAAGPTRDSLLRTLFLIALGGTLLALLLAAVVGDSVGARLRRLTVAADSIRQGGRGVKAGLGGVDEVGLLGAAFDSMATSIDEKTAALKRAADQEAALRTRLEAVVAGMAEALVAVDQRGRITDFNQAAEELLGVSAAWALGQSVSRVASLHDDQGRDLSVRLQHPPTGRWTRQAWVRTAGSALDLGDPVAIPTGGSRSDAIPVAISAGALRDGDRRLVGGVFLVHDLRQERAVEQMKSEFLSRAGHELRTPLTGIIGFTDLLGRSDIPPEQAQLWRAEIVEQSKRLLRTVELLEFFAWAGSGNPPLRLERTDLGGLVGEAVQRWNARLERSSWSLVQATSEPVPPVAVDRRWVALAIDELVDNAVKFSPDGGRIVVGLVCDPSGRAAEISVADQGKGMSSEEAAQAFTDFVQGDGSDTRRYGGLGLGLALVKRVAEGHGGQVRWESKPGGGATVAIVVPVAGRTRAIDA